jgi:hypothetical protein
MAENELKPCPLCGNKNILLEVIEPHTHSEWLKEQIPIPDCEGECFIECGKCSCAVNGKTKEEAITRWNRRANDGRE